MKTSSNPHCGKHPCGDVCSCYRRRDLLEGAWWLSRPNDTDGVERILHCLAGQLILNELAADLSHDRLVRPTVAFVEQAEDRDQENGQSYGDTACPPAVW